MQIYNDLFENTLKDASNDYYMTKIVNDVF